MAAVKAPVPEKSTQSLEVSASTVSAVCWSTTSASTTVETRKASVSSTTAVTEMEMSLPRTPGYLAVAVNAPLVAAAFSAPVAVGRYKRTVFGGLVRLLPLKISVRNRFLLCVIS